MREGVCVGARERTMYFETMRACDHTCPMSRERVTSSRKESKNSDVQAPAPPARGCRARPRGPARARSPRVRRSPIGSPRTPKRNEIININKGKAERSAAAQDGDGSRRIMVWCVECARVLVHPEGYHNFTWREHRPPPARGGCGTYRGDSGDERLNGAQGGEREPRAHASRCNAARRPDSTRASQSSRHDVRLTSHTLRPQPTALLRRMEHRCSRGKALLPLRGRGLLLAAGLQVFVALPLR